MKMRSLSVVGLCFLLMVGLSGQVGADVKKRQLVTDVEGRLILLKDDYTWEFIDTTLDEKKVIVTITNAKTFFKQTQKKDDMDDIVGYRQSLGCEYFLTVENKTPYLTKIKIIEMVSTISGLPYNRNSMNEKIEPGKKSVNKRGNSWKIYREVSETKEPVTEAQRNDLKKQYGCSTQLGTIFIREMESDSDWDRRLITFSKSSGITDEARKSLIVGNPNGYYPLRKEVCWHNRARDCF